MDPAQTYETTIYNRDGGSPFTFLTIPGRSVADGIQTPDAYRFAQRLGFENRASAMGNPSKLLP